MNYIRDLVNRVSYRVYASSKPEVFRPSERDVYLVSYPRSGNTWMRVILAELMYGKSGDGLKDLEYYIPDILVRNLKHDVIESKVHVIKSHQPCLSASDTPLYRRVIYLIRDPRDVVISHYRYSRARGNSCDFDHFLLDWIAGRIWPTSWREHVSSWTGVGIEYKKLEICILRYEDLLSEPQVQISKVVDFVGLEKSQEAIKSAIELASVDRMRVKEKLGLRDGENVEGMQFIGDAISNQWIEQLSDKQVKLIEEYSGKEMMKFGYL